MLKKIEFTKILFILFLILVISSALYLALRPAPQTCAGKESFFIGKNLICWTVILAGLVDGINPCAIGMILFLLGYLIIFANKPEKVLPIGTIYISTVFLTYFLIGVVFYKFISLHVLVGYRSIINLILGFLLILAGLINVKDFFWYEQGVTLRIPTKTRPFLQGLVEKTSAPMAVVLGFFVTILETPCSLPLYVGTVSSMINVGLSKLSTLLHLILYNFLFVLPLIVILILIIFGAQMVALKEWEHKSKKYMKLSLGLILLILGFWLVATK
jgi:cytochrome c biogenesis protein CcdA